MYTNILIIDISFNIEIHVSHKTAIVPEKFTMKKLLHIWMVDRIIQDLIRKAFYVLDRLFI